jgi:hypothetical protein
MDVLNIRQNKVFDKELDLIAKQDDKEIKYKNLIENIGIRRTTRAMPMNMK